MSIFNFKDCEALGKVKVVDTATVVVHVSNIEGLRRLQVNRLVLLHSSKPGQHLIGIVQKIARSSKEMEAIGENKENNEETLVEENIVRVSLIGTHIDKGEGELDVFRRTLETVPEIDANCFAIEGEQLTNFMQVIANVASEGQKLELGTYTLDEKATAFLNGNKFFQRHAIIVGSTGSGKSWTTAQVLEEIVKLQNANVLVFDLHGEYEPLNGKGFEHYRIAGPADLDSKKGLQNGIVYLPYWLLGYEALISMLVDRSDQNAPNQSMLIARSIGQNKEKFLKDGKHQDILDNFTIDSPIPFEIDDVIAELKEKNEEMVPGARSEKQGPYFDKLSRLISRLENKLTDRRLGFLFQGGEETKKFDWLDKLSTALIAGAKDQPNEKGGIKIIDFSEVPSDILPLIVSLVARLAFSIQQWLEPKKRHPIALFCDEAHLYIPERTQGNSENDVSISIFERISKEGRKYGLGLVVITQRPSEVNKTVLSQCNNFVSMRLTNADDQNVIKRLLPDSLGGFSDLLPILDTGEALVVGDASLLPCRIRVTEPNKKPNSGTVDFWDKWNSNTKYEAISEAVKSWRKQTQKS